MKTLADIAANLIAVIHLAYFAFVVGGMLAIVFNRSRPTSWVRNPWFRIAHIASIYIVLFEDLTGLPCPLNVLQWGARTAATGSTETNVGVGGVLDFLLYHTISPLALDIMYWSFGVLVLALLWIVPPHANRMKRRTLLLLASAVAVCTLAIGAYYLWHRNPAGFVPDATTYDDYAGYYVSPDGRYT